MAKGKPITEIEIKHTLLMARYDLAARNIANILKRSTSSVYRILRQHGIAARPDERTEEQHQTADRLLHGVVPLADMIAAAPPEPVEPEPTMTMTDRTIQRLTRWIGGNSEPEPVAIDTPLELVEFVCKECGEEFSLTTDHIEWFESRHINVPKRCQPCRERRREMHDGGGLIGGVNLDELAALRRRLEDMERRLDQ